MSKTPLEAHDFWRVNSYGYPNPFNPDSKSQEAWATFEAFCQHNGAPYSSLKAFWASNDAPRKLDGHAVESWKATFEECGLLYVISRSNVVTITPAGVQLLQAAQEENDEQFVWIGLNLLFRYPLRGPPRRGRTPAHNSSDLLPYRFIYSAMRDLSDYFWWAELERVLCRVFATSDAKYAVELVRHLRETPTELANVPLPVANKKGAFYNSLNQVANHAGLNHFSLEQDSTSDHYGPNESRRRHSISRKYLSLVSAALGDFAAPSGCAASAMYVDRLPTAPSFTDEQNYFDYMGATVSPLSVNNMAAGPQAVNIGGDTVFVLKEGEHFQTGSRSGTTQKVTGKPSLLCRIARSHRVILSNDKNWTYIVRNKAIVGPEDVELELQRARPITNIGPIATILEVDDA